MAKMVTMQRDYPLRYIDNAKKFLKESHIEGGAYSDIKYVKGAFGVVWSGILKAIDEYLVSNEHMLERELPRSKGEYQKALKKYVSIRNGKLQKMFNDLYHEIHIAGYYRGDIRSANLVKEALKNARAFIEKLT